jgi:hypothetical protein
MSFLHRFYKYQDERFPVKVLFFTTWAVVLSSAAILGYHTSFFQMLMAFTACLFFLYHIRVIDEHRDFEHDEAYHKDRPVQRGLIKISELFWVDVFALIVFVTICIWYGVPAIVYGSALLIFSFFAWKDFFGGPRLKKKFYLYNAINMFQMVLLQLLIYAILTLNFKVNSVMWIHLLFVIWNTLIMEVVRKIKTAETESSGKDTYSYHMGFRQSLRVFYLFSLANYFTFNWMLFALQPQLNFYYLWAFLLFALLTFSVIWHRKKQAEKTEGLLFLSTIINYVGLNLLIYFFNL